MCAAAAFLASLIDAGSEIWLRKNSLAYKRLMTSYAVKKNEVLFKVRALKFQPKWQRQLMKCLDGCNQMEVMADLYVVQKLCRFSTQNNLVSFGKDKSAFYTIRVILQSVCHRFPIKI